MEKTKQADDKTVKILFELEDGLKATEIVKKSVFAKYKSALKALAHTGQKLTEKQKLALLIGFNETTSSKEGDLILDAIRNFLDGKKLNLPLGREGKNIEFTLLRNKHNSGVCLKDGNGQFLAKSLGFWQRGEDDKSIGRYAPFSSFGVVKSKSGEYSVFVEK